MNYQIENIDALLVTSCRLLIKNYTMYRFYMVPEQSACSLKSVLVRVWYEGEYWIPVHSRSIERS